MHEEQALLPNLRHSRLQHIPASGPYNSLHDWAHIVPPLRVVRNFLIIYLNRFMPSLRLKNILYRLTGMKVGAHCAFGLMSMVDIFFPELITVGDNTIIGYNTVLLGHEFLQRELRIGPVVIGPNVTIGANCTILPGVTIGEGATVSAMSLVNRDVPPHTFVGGVPIRILHTSSDGGKNLETP